MNESDRTWIATHVLAALVSRHSFDLTYQAIEVASAKIASKAVILADALIAALSKPRPE